MGRIESGPAAVALGGRLHRVDRFPAFSGEHRQTIERTQADGGLQPLLRPIGTGGVGLEDDDVRRCDEQGEDAQAMRRRDSDQSSRDMVVLLVEVVVGWVGGAAVCRPGAVTTVIAVLRLVPSDSCRDTL